MKPSQTLLHRLLGLQKAIATLRERRVTGVGIYGAFHKRRVAPVMARPISLWEMTAEKMNEPAVRTATVLAEGSPSDFEVTQRIVEALEGDFNGFPIDGHPPMRPNEGAVDL